MARRLGNVRRVIAVTGLALAGVFVFAGCNMKENKAATRACAKAATGKACHACCGMNGSNVSNAVNGCTCY